MKLDCLTESEKEAVLYLFEYESVKIAADMRCVSLHTEKNQVKAAMQKLNVHTQGGLFKVVMQSVFGVRFNLMEHIRKAEKALACALLGLFLVSINHNDAFVRRFRRSMVRKDDIEYVKI
jgi:hypothetical protein